MNYRILVIVFCLVFISGVFLPKAALAAQVDASSATGGLRYTVAVAKFENRAGWSGQFDIGDAWGTIMTDILNRSGKFIVLAENDMRREAMAEQDLAASGRTVQGAITPSTGNMTPAQILIKGAITHVEEKASGTGGGIGLGNIVVGGNKATAEINVTMYMVHSTTGQILASTSVVGKSKASGFVLGWGGKVPGAYGNYKKSNVGKAIEHAVAQGVEWMSQELPSITWRGNVVMVRDDKVYINRGSREGVKNGMEFVVGYAEAIRDPNTGEVLDVSFSESHRINVISVRDKLAICELVSGDIDALESGMVVQLP